MGRRWERLVAALGLVALGVLHVDAWRSPGARVFLGWVPEELLYRLVWVLLAWGYLLLLFARFWTDEEGRS